MFLKYQYNTDISFSLLLRLTRYFPTIIRPINYFWKLILKKILDPLELNCSVIFSLYCLRVSKKIDHFFEISYAEKEYSPGSMSIHFLSFIGMMLGTSTGSLLCGFVFAFDLAAKTFTIDCDACSSSRSAGTSVLL